MAKVILTSSIYLLREGMKGILAEHRDIHIGGVFSCATDLCARSIYHQGEIIVFAVPVLDLTGEILDELSSRYSPLKIVVITPAKEMRAHLEAFRHGVRGILAAESVASSFPDAIRTVHSGKAYVSGEFLDLFTQHAQLKNFSAAYESLSEREQKVFACIAVGKRNCTIGSELDISSKTVSTHKMRLMDKLGVNSVPELIQYALQSGLMDIVYRDASK